MTRLLNTRLHPRPIAQRTSQYGRYVKGYQRWLYLSRCEESFREEMTRLVAWTLVKYTPLRPPHPAHRPLIRRRREDRLARGGQGENDHIVHAVAVHSSTGELLFSGLGKDYEAWQRERRFLTGTAPDQGDTLE